MRCMRIRIRWLLAPLLLIAVEPAVIHAEKQEADGRRPLEVRVIDDAGRPVPGAVGTLSRYRVPTPPFTHAAARVNRGLFGPPDTTSDGRLIGKRELTADADGMLRTYADPREQLSLVVRGDASHIAAMWHGSTADASPLHREVVLRRGRVITGRVRIGDEGVPAYVTVGWSLQSQPWYAAVAWHGVWFPQDIPTDADGAFRFTIPAKARAQITAYVPGRYRRDAVPVEVGEESKIDLRLDVAEGVTLRGVLTTQDGKPIAGARIWAGVDDPLTRRGWSVMGPTHQHIGMTQSDAEGRYEIRGLQPGYVKNIMASADGYALGSVEQIAFPVRAGESLRVDLALSPAIPITGRVLDEQDRPIVGAAVNFAAHVPGRIPGQSHPITQALTDDEGRYQLAAVAGTAGVVSVSADGHLYVDADEPDASPAMRRRLAGRPVVIPASGNLQLEPLRMRRGIPVEGWVITPQGTPVPHVGVVATVTAEILPPGQPPRPSRIVGSNASAQTDAAGKFRFTGLPDNTRLRLSLAGARPGATAMPIEIRGGKGPDPVRVYQRSTTTISGRVLRMDGRPAAHAQVVLTPGRGIVAMADQAGRFRLTGIQRGQVVVAVHRVDNGESRRVLDVDGETPLTGIELRIEGKGRLTGLVQDAAGKPLAGKPVSLTHVRLSRQGGANVYATTDHEGRFRLTHLPIGTYTASSEGGTAMIDVGAEPAEVVVKAVHHEPWIIEGEVVDAAGRPVPRGQVGVRIGGHSVRSFPIVAGRFAVAHWDRSNHKTVDVVAHHAADARGRSLGLGPTVVSGYEQGAKPLVLRMEQGRRAYGFLRDPQGAPLVGYKISLAAKERPWWSQGRNPAQTTDAEGAFAFEGIPPSEVTITVLEDSRLATHPQHVVTDGASPIELVAVPARTLEARVVDGEGNPIEEMKVYVFVDKADTQDGKPSASARVTREKDGRITAAGLHPARVWTVRIDEAKRGDTRFMREVRRLETLPSKPLTIQLRAFAKLKGRVELPEGAPQGAFDVHLDAWYLDSPRPRKRIRVKAGEREFTIGDVVPGRYRLTVRPHGEFKKPEPFAVDVPGEEVVVRLERAFPIRGRIEGPGRKRATVHFYPAGRDRRSTEQLRWSRATTGRPFMISNERDVRGTLVAYTEEGTAALLTNIHPDEGPFTLTLEPTWTLHGVVEAFPMKRLSKGLSITLVCGDWWRRTVIKDGTFVFKEIPKGRFTLEIESADRLAGRIELPASVDASTPSVVLKYIAADDAKEDGR